MLACGGERSTVNTGKVEYAPDYKSDIEREIAEIFKADMITARQRVATENEHARLQSVVVETARMWRKEFGGNMHLETLATTALAQDVDALIAFEAENNIGESKDGPAGT